MRAVIQRVTHAQCLCDGEITGKIEQGFMILLGIKDGDGQEEAKLIARKIAGMRIFCDSEDKMNLSLSAVGGRILLISQFTLYADCHRGNRPSFTQAARPETAAPLYEYMAELLKNEYGLEVEMGVFGADMQISLTNDGPVTIILDTDDL